MDSKSNLEFAFDIKNKSLIWKNLSLPSLDAKKFQMSNVWQTI